MSKKIGEKNCQERARLVTIRNCRLHDAMPEVSLVLGNIIGRSDTKDNITINLATWSGALKTFLMCMCVAAKKRSTGRWEKHDDCCTRSKHHAWTCVQNTKKTENTCSIAGPPQPSQRKMLSIHCSGAVNPYLHFSDVISSCTESLTSSNSSKCTGNVSFQLPRSAFIFCAPSAQHRMSSLSSPNSFWKNPLPPMFSPSSIHCRPSSKLLNSTSALLAEETIAKAATSKRLHEKQRFSCNAPCQPPCHNMRMNTSVRPNRPDAVVAPTPPILLCGAPSDLQHCVSRVPTTSLRSRRVCDSSFAAISNHSIQVARKIDLTPCNLSCSPSLNHSPRDQTPQSVSRIKSPRINKLEEPFRTLTNLQTQNFQQHHRTAKHSVQKLNTSSHSEAITHTPPLTHSSISTLPIDMNLHSPMRRSRCTSPRRLYYHARHLLDALTSHMSADLVTASDLSEASPKTASFSTWSSPFSAVSVRETFTLCNLSIHLLENFSEHE